MFVYLFVCIYICKKGRKEALPPHLINHLKGWGNNISFRPAVMRSLSFWGKNRRRENYRFCCMWHTRCWGLKSWPQICVDRMLFMQSCVPDHVMREKNALEQIQWDFKQTSYFILHVGTVCKTKALKKIISDLHVSVSLTHLSIYPAKAWSLQTNMIADEGTAYRDTMLSNQWTRGKSSPLVTIILKLFTKYLP